MGEVRLTWTGERLQFLAETAYGEPVVVGGNASGPGAKPSDLLPVSLAACTAYDVVEILRKQRQDLRSLEVVVTSVQDPDPPWTFRSIHQSFLLKGTIDERKAARAIDLAERKYCSVAATLRSVVELTHSLQVSRDLEDA
jgi:putative redox protein